MGWFTTIRRKMWSPGTPSSPTYDGVGGGRRAHAWSVGNPGAVQALLTTQNELRAKSRDLVRRNAWANAALESYVANAVGTGIKPQSMVQDAQLREAIQALWRDWTVDADAAGLTDFYGLQALACRAMLEGGEALARLRYRRPEDGLAVALQIQVLEAEHLPVTLNTTAENGNVIRAGIEFDRLGRRVAYHLFRSHPEEGMLSPMSSAGGLNTVRVDATEIVHLFRPMRPGQIRGEPWLARALVKLHELDQYDDAELVRKKTAAMFAGFVTRLAPDDNLLGEGLSDANGIALAGLEPGTMQMLEPGEDIKFSQPADVGGSYSEFLRMQFRAVAAAMGVTYEQLTGDLTQVNYSSIRAGLLEFRRRVESLQHGVIVHQLCRPIWQAWMDQAVLEGAVTLTGYAAGDAHARRRHQAVKWIPQGWQWVDPLKEIDAMSELDVPSWVDMKDLREQIAKAQAGRVEATRLQTEAQDNAKKAAKALVAAKSLREQAEATLALADAAMGNTETNVTRAENVVLQEELACKTGAERKLASVRRQLHDLAEERRKLNEEAASRLTSLKADYTARRDRLRDEYNEATQRLDGEQLGAEQRRKDQQMALEADIARELAGLGIDPQRVASLESEISHLGGLLNSIASNRHEVTLWRKFRVEIEPLLPTWRREAQEAKERLDKEKSVRLEHGRSLTNLQTDARLEFQRMDTGIQKREQELTSLKSLRDGPLAMFDAYVPSKLHVDWSVETLKEKIEGLRESLRVEALDLQAKSRALRNLMLSKAGGVQQWVELREKELPDEQTLHEHEWFCEKARVLIDWFEPMECGPYIDQINKEMVGFMDLASTFVGDLDLFDRRIQTFNTQLQKALSDTAKFERFRDLSVTVKSGVNQIEYLNVLRKMRDVSLSRHSSWRTHSIQERELPTVDDVMLVRQFKDILPADGRVQVNLSEHVRLECSLVENGQARRITNQEEFQAVSSNGNTALITAMFLMGFVQMIRGTDSGVRLTWVTDEVGRFDAGNLASFT